MTKLRGFFGKMSPLLPSLRLRERDSFRGEVFVAHNRFRQAQPLHHLEREAIGEPRCVHKDGFHRQRGI